MRVARAILWRSRTVKRLAGLVTGLHFDEAPTGTTNLAAGPDVPGIVEQPRRRESELTKALRRQQKARGGELAGVMFTFIVYENQRRWVGLGWTTSLFGYERAAWTDEHNNPVPPRDDFELPEVEEGARARWRWVAGSRWRVDGVKEDLSDYDTDSGKMGWVYYDNKVSHLSDSFEIFPRPMLCTCTFGKGVEMCGDCLGRLEMGRRSAQA